MVKHNVAQLRRWEFKHIRYFLKLRRTHCEEGSFEYNRRTKRLILKLFAKYAIDPIYIKVVQ